MQTYQQAIKELEQIVAEMEQNGPIEMDAYLAKTRRASELIRYCKERLHHFDDEIQQILSENQPRTGDSEHPDE
ncbi:MAG: exodeoxyribonuclease VII small subunit [Paludibacteraceae bacterium]|nr:exodeoxyribonuclease VII small subunit [Paludibacteraceae bacterium]